MTPDQALMWVQKIFAFGVAFGLLVFVHEFGHYVVAKWCGVTVEVFSFGFGRRLWGFERKGTDYRISLVPLGGYVKMLGETHEDEVTGDPGEFSSKPKWQRFAILVAGATMNIVLAVLCYAVVFTKGDKRYLHMDAPVVVGGVHDGMPAQKAGVLPGDRIVEVDGKAVETWQDFLLLELLKPDKPVVLSILRDGRPQKITVQATSLKETITNSKVGSIGVEPRGEVLAGSVTSGTPAERADLRTGDRIVSLDGDPIWDLASLVRTIRSSEGKPILFVLERGGEVLEKEITPVMGPRGFQTGFYPDYPYEVVSYTLWQAFPRAIEEATEQVFFTYFTLKSLLTREVPLQQVSGPIGIFQFTGKAAETGWDSYVRVIGLISLQLGIINLLPIPVLDGGHIFILLIEGIMRRDLSITLKERVTNVGLFFLMSLMVVVIFNDISKNVEGGLERFLPWGGP